MALVPARPRPRLARASPATAATSRRYLGEKYGGGREAGLQMNARVSEVAAQDGLEYHLDRAVRGSTADAHRLIHLAATVDADGTAGLQDTVKERFLEAYFTEGQDVSTPPCCACWPSRPGCPPSRSTTCWPAAPSPATWSPTRRRPRPTAPTACRSRSSTGVRRLRRPAGRGVRRGPASGGRGPGTHPRHGRRAGRHRLDRCRRRGLRARRLRDLTQTSPQHRRRSPTA